MKWVESGLESLLDCDARVKVFGWRREGEWVMMWEHDKRGREGKRKIFGGIDACIQ